MESQITITMNYTYRVEAWKNQWYGISEHLSKSDAEIIKAMIENGDKAKHINGMIELQNQICKSVTLPDFRILN